MPVKYVDGKLIYIDENGDEIIIPAPPPTKSAPGPEPAMPYQMRGDFNIQGTPKTGFESRPGFQGTRFLTFGLPTVEETKDLSTAFYNRLGQYTKPGLSAIGSMVGLPGGVIGTTVGAGGGYAIGELLQNIAPRLFGNPPQTPGESLFGMGQEIGSNLIGEGLGRGISAFAFPSVRQQLKERVARKYFKPSVDEELLKALKLDPNFEYTLGQVSPEGSSARLLEKYYGGAEKRAIERTQKLNIKKDIAQWISNPEAIIDLAKLEGKQTLAALKSQVQAAYEAFEPAIKYNTKKVAKVTKQKPAFGLGAANTPKTKVEYIDIEGAIQPKQSYAFAREVGDELDQILGPTDINQAYAGTKTGSYLAHLRSELDKIRGLQQFKNPADITKDAPLYAEYKQLKAIKDGLNRYIWDKDSDPLKDRLMGGLKKLAASLDADIDAGVQSWGKNAYTRYTNAQNMYKEMALKVDNSLATQLLAAGADGNTTYMQVAEAALSNPQRMREFINITGDKLTARQLYMDDLVRNATDPKNFDQFNAGKALEYLHNTEGVGKEVLGHYRSHMKRFFQRAQITENNGMNSSLKWVQGRAALSIATGSIAGGIGGYLPYGAVAGTLLLGAGPGIKSFVKNVLMDPKVARVATENLNLSPLTPGAKRGQKIILNALKGTQAIFVDRNGNNHPAEIGPDGKVNIIDPQAPVSTDDEEYPSFKMN